MRMTVKDLCERIGMSQSELLEEFQDESIALCTVCSEDGGIELDGTCPHGHPSLHMELGLV